jgi:hypothetical protein
VELNGDFRLTVLLTPLFLRNRNPDKFARYSSHTDVLSAAPPRFQLAHCLRFAIEHGKEIVFVDGL